MAFEQFKFERVSYQTRGIFNTYAYETNDTMATVLADGYFDACRFKDEDGWIGGVISVRYGQNIINLKIQTDGTVFPLTGEGATFGWYNYQDTATATTPISVPSGNVDTTLTNDALGPLTSNQYRLIEVSDIWNPSTNRFDFTGLNIGDVLIIRVDLQVTTTSNFQFIDVDMELGQGSGIDVEIQFYKGQFKEQDDHNVIATQQLAILSEQTRDYPAELRIQSDASCDVLVRGWFCTVLRR